MYVTGGSDLTTNTTTSNEPNNADSILRASIGGSPSSVSTFQLDNSSSIVLVDSFRVQDTSD